jgi:hypothetical protein
VSSPQTAPASASHIALTLDTMWSIKDYLLSGTIARFARDFRVTCWVPAPLLADTRRLAAEIGIPSVEFRAAPVMAPSPLYNLVCGLHKSLLYERHDVDTERVLRKRQSGPTVWSRSIARRCAGWLIRALAKSPFATLLDRVLDRVRIRMAVDPAGARELDAVSPDLLFITDPVRREFDALFFEARRRRIRTACLVLSWDNVTSKGRINSGFDRIFCWNQSMRADVVKMYGRQPPESIQVVGFPRFDIYRNDLPPKFAREPFMRSVGLDPARPYILFANGATSFFPAQPEIVEHICAALDAGNFPAGTQLFVRCHPHDDVSIYARFRSRAGVAVWPDEARVRGKTLFDLPPQADELLTLGATIRHSAVCVNAGSTVMLDASLADVPVVTVAYDGDQQMPYWQSFRSCYEYSHQQYFHAFKATEFANDRGELIQAINRALLEPGLRRTERARAAAYFLGGRDESSVDRLSAALHELMRGERA